MPDRIYLGPCPAVDVVLPDGSTTHCERDKPQSLPAEVVVHLDQQGNWETPAAKTKTAHKGENKE